MLSKILLFTQGQDLSWDVSNAVPTADDLYVNRSGEEGLSASSIYTSSTSQEFSLRNTSAFRLASDGRKLITTNEDEIKSFSLNPSFSLAYPDYAQVGTALDVSSVETVVTGIYVKDDGFKMYIVGTDYDAVHEYVMTTAWDVSTASLNHSYDYTAESTPEAVQAKSITFRPDGKRFWLTKSDATDVFEFDLTDAWDLSTASFNVRHFEANTGTEDDFDFSPDGRYVISTYGNAQRVQKLSVPYDLGSEITLVGNFGIGDAQTGTTCVQVLLNGASVAITIGTGAVRNLVISNFGKRLQLSTSGVQRFDGIKWNNDGTKLYYRQGGTIYSYEFETAYDMYSMTNTNLATPNTEVEFPTTKLDASWDVALGGTKLYTLYEVSSTANIYGWNLSSAYDFSSASQDGSSYLSVSSYHKNPTCISASYDGTKLYVLGYNPAGTDILITQYDIDPDGSVADATYDGALTVTDDGRPRYADNDTALIAGMNAMHWKHDGTRLFIPRWHQKRISGVTRATQPHILEYRLTSPWDITSATLHQYQPVRSNSNGATGLTFHPEGLRFWMSGGYDITEYSLEET